MTNRVTERFKALDKAGEKGFVAYIVAGDPDLETTKQLVLEFDRIGVDFVELGVPFSDPVADGVVNQMGAERAIKGGTNLRKVFDTVSQIRESSEIPIILFTYFNPLHHFGIEEFVAKAAECGVDGALVVDLPPEESKEYKALFEHAGFSRVSQKRLKGLLLTRGKKVSPD